MGMNKRGQTAILFLLLFGTSLIFYAVMFPEMITIMDEAKASVTDETVILIYDLLPFGIGFMLILSTIASIAAIVR